MLNNLSGIGALQEALDTTNALLADVLAELKETNSKQLESIAAELRLLNENAQAASMSTWCARGELNPTPFRAHGPEPCASAYSATRARSGHRLSHPVSATQTAAGPR